MANKFTRIISRKQRTHTIKLNFKRKNHIYRTIDINRYKIFERERDIKDYKIIRLQIFEEIICFVHFVCPYAVIFG